jgi:hypothetical protein
VTDECGDSAKVDALLQNFAGRLVRFANSGYIRPLTFLSIGGQKLFRDAVWGGMRLTFQADHKTYKKLGVYDFPRQSLGTRITSGIMTLLLKVPRFRKRVHQENSSRNDSANSKGA